MEEEKSKSSVELESSSYPKWCGVPYEEIVCCLSFILGIAQMYLPKEKIDGNPVPTILFKGQPNTYHAFLMGIIVSFCCSITTIYTRDPKPKFARYYRQISVLAMAFTLLILFWVLCKSLAFVNFATGSDENDQTL